MAKLTITYKPLTVTLSAWCEASVRELQAEIAKGGAVARQAREQLDELLDGEEVMVCACRPEDGVQCMFHARAPRPCPTGCGGTMFLDVTATRMVPCAVTSRGYAVSGDVRRMPKGRGAWGCNRCEHCE